jgi:HK97 family phage portal protein
MSLFRGQTEQRLIQSPALRAFATGNDNPLGTSQQAALTLVPVYAATALIADSISIMPVSGYRKVRGVPRLLPNQPELLISPHPNPLFTRPEWLHQFTTSYLLRGNAYGKILDWDDRLIPSKIAWLHPDAVRVDERNPAAPKYYYNGVLQDIDSFVHIPWYPQPGSIVGLSPIGQFRAQLEVGTSATNFGRNWFKRGSVPSGHFKFSAGPLNDTQTARIKERFKAAVDGGDVLVTGNDWDWKALSVTPDEAQFLQTIKATANQIAAIFRVNPEDIGGEPGSSLTYSTVELNQIKLNTRTLQPIFTRLEHHITRHMPGDEYVKFNPDALIRTDLKSRMEAHEIALRVGVETNPEARALEEKAPLTPGEIADWQKLYGKVQSAPPAPANNQGGKQNA